LPLEITFIRHGQTTGNAGGRWQGHTNASLTDLGRAQAEKLAASLEETEFDLVVSSDLDRTMETAAALGLPIEADVRWREPNFGKWEDLTTAQIMTRDPDTLAALFNGENIAPGGGELLSDVVERTGAAVDDLVSRVGEGSVAVVSHGMALLLLLANRLGTRLPTPLRLLGNTSTATVQMTGDGLSVTSYNDDTHLGHTALPHFGASPDDTEMLLIRHGRTISNDEGRWQGHTDGKLNPVGRRQAAALADELPPLQALYSSPLSRAADTARAIADRQQLDVRYAEDLKEIGFGAWEGMTRAEIATAFPDEYAEFNIGGDDAARGGNGETFAGVRRRMAAALSAIVADHPGQDVGVVSHGGVTRAYVTEVLGIPYENRQRLGLLSNTGYARMAYTGRGPTLVSWNLAPHLKG
jgi:broad specificity phosphatase PhoE